MALIVLDVWPLEQICVVVVFWNHYKFVEINKSGSFCIWLHLDVDDKLS